MNANQLKKKLTAMGVKKTSGKKVKDLHADLERAKADKSNPNHNIGKVKSSPSDRI